jgi:hypothetical protein
MAEVEPNQKKIVNEQPEKVVDDHEEQYTEAPLKAGHLPDEVVETLKKSLS